MRRRLFNFVTAASLLLCVAACVLWVRSFFLTEQLTLRCKGGWRTVQTGKGQLAIRLLLADWSNVPADTFGPKYQRDLVMPPSNYFIYLSPERGDRSFFWRRGGFAWHELRNARRGIVRVQAWAPFWSIFICTAALPLAWTTTRLRARVRRRRRTRLGLCPVCGYDLRATPRGGRCPECGASGTR